MPARILEKIDHASGCGGFLNPPTHPEHAKSVVTDLNRHPHHRGVCSLSYATSAEWIAPAVRAQAARILAEWQPPALTSPEVVAWIRKVLGYFCSCYIRPYGGQNASDLLAAPRLDPLANAHTHAGVAFIRQFYPAYVPTRDDFNQARWGN